MAMVELHVTCMWALFEMKYIQRDTCKDYIKSTNSLNIVKFNILIITNIAHLCTRNQVEYLTEHRDRLIKYTSSLFLENVVSSNIEISQVRPVPIF